MKKSFGYDALVMDSAVSGPIINTFFHGCFAGEIAKNLLAGQVVLVEKKQLRLLTGSAK
jgi:hypothetical protein